MRGIEELNSVVAGLRQKADWADLRIFLVVADTGSFSGAAKSLRITQPTVSTRMRELEYRLGAQLFVRTGNSFQLTEAGASIRQHVQTMDRSATAIERLIGDQDRHNEGRVRISAPDGVAAFWLGPRLAEFVSENPKIAVSIDCGLWPNDAVRDDVDLFLQFEENKIQDNIVKPIATFHYGVYASPRYLEMYGRPKTAAEIANHRAIHHTAQSRQKENWAPSTSALQTLWTNQIETNSSATMFFALRAGGGVALMPTGVSTIAPELEMLGEPAAKLKLWLVYHRDIARIGRVRQVIAWLSGIFDAQHQPWFRDDFVHPDEFRHRHTDKLTDPVAATY